MTDTLIESWKTSKSSILPWRISKCNKDGHACMQIILLAWRAVKGETVEQLCCSLLEFQLFSSSGHCALLVDLWICHLEANSSRHEFSRKMYLAIFYRFQTHWKMFFIPRHSSQFFASKWCLQRVHTAMVVSPRNCWLSITFGIWWCHNHASSCQTKGGLPHLLSLHLTKPRFFTCKMKMLMMWEYLERGVMDVSSTVSTRIAGWK